MYKMNSAAKSSKAISKCVKMAWKRKLNKALYDKLEDVERLNSQTLQISCLNQVKVTNGRSTRWPLKNLN